MNDIPAKVNGTQIEFLRKKNGDIMPIFANVVTLLRENIYTWDLGYDEFSCRMFKGQEFLEDRHFLELTEWVQRHQIPASFDVITMAASHIARERPFHQVRDYLELLTWDGTDRLDQLLTTYAGVRDTTLTRIQSAKWMMQACARVFEPGCQADATLVFEGPQGLGKSSFFRTLFGDKWFTDHLPDLTTKDALLQLRGVWCVEIAELATFTKADAKRINQFLTSRIDRYRDPYGRLVADYPRQNVFAGTVNPGASGYLKDETGARRFWSVETSGEMNLSRLSDDRDQIWAEAVTRYKEGEAWYLNNRANARDAAQAQAERFVDDPWQGPIEIYISDKTDVSLPEVFADCLNITAKSDWDQKSMNRIAACLAHLGWQRFKRSADSKGNRMRAYRRGPGSAPVVSQYDSDQHGQEKDNDYNDL